jgi:transcriptional regulator with XRE-family HTH domain
VNYPASLNSSQGVATSTGLGWRNAAELGGDIKRNTHGVHRTYIGMIERAEKNITLLNIEKIAKALGLKISETLRDI